MSRSTRPTTRQSSSSLSADARRSRFDGGGEPPGTLSFDALDPDETYTPRNTASPLVRAWRAWGAVSTSGPPTAGGSTPSATASSCSATAGPLALHGDVHRRGRPARAGGLHDLIAPVDTDATPQASRAAAPVSRGAGRRPLHDLTSEGPESSSFTDGTSDSTGLLEHLERLDAADGHAARLRAPRGGRAPDGADRTR